MFVILRLDLSSENPVMLLCSNVFSIQERFNIHFKSSLNNFTNSKFRLMFKKFDDAFVL